MKKTYDHWNGVKQGLNREERLPVFKEREIWWTSVGMNVGSEIYGKGNAYTRPVLILRKFSKYQFLGVPLTSKRKEGSYFHPVSFRGVEGSALLIQQRLMDCRRLQDRMGWLTDPQFNEIRKRLKHLI